MSTARLTALPADAPLEEIQDAILDRLHAGEPVDRRAVLQHHAPHAEALARFFELLDLIETPPGAPPAVPHRLGDFEIVKEIGRGGMGVVYEARQLSLNRRVALKVLPPDVRADRQRLARFRREAEAAGRLRHPNIVPVYSIGDPESAPFFAMELVDGHSLAEILRARRAGEDLGLPAAGEDWQRWCLGVGVKIAEALAHAHGQGILHRDVKPGNILIDSHGAPRLTDFGLALDLGTTSLTVSGEVFGSPRYMSPEQARMREHPVDARTDIYSLAVTLYELLTLKMPYSGNTSADILASLSSGRIVPPSVADPTLPGDIERILMHALQNDPEQRYVSAAELAGDLAAVLEGSRPAAAPKRWKRSGRRGPRSATHKLVFTILAVLVGLGVALVLFMLGAALLGALFLGTSAVAPGQVEAERLSALADGSLPEPGPVLEAWLEPSFETRSVISRAEPGQALFSVTGTLPEDADGDFVLVMVPEVSVDGGDWIGAPVPLSGSSLEPGVVQTFTSSIAWLTLLDADELQRDVLHVTPRLQLRLTRPPTPSTSVTPTQLFTPQLPAAGGGTWTWNGAPRTLALYDQYPDDYPAAVFGPEFDETMAAAMQPDALVFQGLRSFSPGGRTLEFLMRFDHQRSGPLPAAFDVALYTVDGDQPIAHTDYTCDAAPALQPGGPVEFSATTTLLFELPSAPGPDDQRLLLDLQAGNVDALRLVFTPSRSAALAEPLFDRYWNRRLDLVVPVVSAPAPKH